MIIFLTKKINLLDLLIEAGSFDMWQHLRVHERECPSIKRALERHDQELNPAWHEMSDETDDDQFGYLYVLTQNFKTT